MIKKLRNEKAKARYRAVKMQPQWVVTPGKQTNKHKRIALKKNIKIYIKTAPTCFGAITIISERIIRPR
jgi:acyl-coenzyme A synthetase/AMP-(fatty) acid ligase